MSITEADLAQARKNWSDALIEIGMAYEAENGFEKARSITENLLDTAYGFDLGPVLFKPTLASGDQTFRTDRKGALSYFLAHDPEYPNDLGFALRGWRNVVSQTAASFTEGDVAIWMGWVTFTDKEGQVTETNKSFGYKRDSKGNLRIVLHHSSLPFQP